MDLNKLKIDGCLDLRSYNAHSGDIDVYFRDIENRLVSHIKNADAVFGAIAWLTSAPIIDALSQLKNVSIVVQKEDFLRPDIDAQKDWKRQLRNRYCSLQCDIRRWDFDGVLNQMSTQDQLYGFGPVRCLGNRNKDHATAFPRMHNKFMVFCKVIDQIWEDDLLKHIIQPYEVWTGSFNFTKNAGVSLENAVVIRSKDIVMAYFNEYQQILALSEPLEWESEWVMPEWRVGT
jgi:hypothetical protein